MKLIQLLLIVLVCELTGVAQNASVSFEGNTGAVRVNLTSNVKPTEKPTAGGLFLIRDGKWNKIADLPTFSSEADPSSFASFTIAFPKSKWDADPKVSYKVSVYGQFVDKDGDPLPPETLIDVKYPLNIYLERDPTCPSGIELVAKTELGHVYDWQPYYAWVNQFPQSPSDIAILELRKTGSASKDHYEINRVRILTPRETAVITGNSRTCLRTTRELPGSGFDGTIKLNRRNLPPDVVAEASAAALEGVFTVELPKYEEIQSPDKRKLERNLDIGITLTSSVADKTTPATSAMPATTLRSRTTRGALDVRFAPWLDVLHPIIRENNWATFLTPIYLNANVATGKITDDTLSLNRIIFGLEAESRYYKSKRWIDDNKQEHHTLPIWHRIKYGFAHASDRDFKQDEFTGKIEYAPIFEALYKPYKFNFVAKNGEAAQRWYGYSFQPKVGFELGRTYHRSNPASVIKPSDTVRRLYFGADVGLDLSAYTSFVVSDTFYIRGEAPHDRTKNYFKGSFDLHFHLENDLSSGVFLSFERGQLAPFSSPSVNAFKVGIRFFGNFCRESCR